MFSYSVRVNKIQNPKNKLLGFADIIIDDVMVVKGFKIFEGPRGAFVKPPAHKGQDKEGGEAWFDDILFTEEKEGDQKQGPVQLEIYQEILNEWAGAKQKPVPTQAQDRQKAAKQQADTNEKKSSSKTQSRYWAE